ncbi:lipid asymmetry maintenance protein MlaB [Serratia sp. AKBS12]|uniref:lipid asymmetry maintenance protein MlaB n=1 Tax=Serratia sp. AKBS12 TaxID=2974597 RepID=UPI0021652DBC|nr:lipid asymmetry maintenance protein MlaB [Serratia sp. AKBS12]MCS3406951.1 lipid asymmetry maintenance protein MlaB [Serratia sp. AKBS12]
MASSLRFDARQQTLVLSGDLDRETLLPLWQQRGSLLAGKTAVDVAQLQRVDSSGLALLVHLCAQQQRQGVELQIIGATDRLKTLITLYNLQEIMPVDTAV